MNGGEGGVGFIPLSLITTSFLPYMRKWIISLFKLVDDVFPRPFKELMFLHQWRFNNKVVKVYDTLMTIRAN
jgi:hypothetical protein